MNIVKYCEAKDISSSRIFLGLLSFVHFWALSGLYLDGWAHRHLDSTMETFLSPWHFVLYSGMLGIAILSSIGLFFYVRKFTTKHAFLHSGYFLGAIGGWGFLASGVLDFTWHTLFGVENNLEALISPPHLLLAIFACMASIGLLKSSKGSRGGKIFLPGLFAYQLMLLGFMTFFVQYAFLGYSIDLFSAVSDVVRSSITDHMAISSFIITTLIWAGFIYLNIFVYRTKAFFVALLLSLNTFMLYLLNYEETSLSAINFVTLFVGICVGGYFIHLARAGRWYTPYFVGLALFTMTAFFLLTEVVINGSIWKIHMYLGVPIIAGIFASILGFLILNIISSTSLPRDLSQ